MSIGHACFSRSRLQRRGGGRICADLAYFITEAATMSLHKIGELAAPGAFCERTPAAIRVSYERSFTLLAVSASVCKAWVSHANQCAQSALPGAWAKRTNSVSGVEYSLAGVGGLNYAADETCFEAKISEGSRTGAWGCRCVFVVGRRRIRGNRCAGGGYTVVGYLPTANHSQ